jgi:hypothetical protein
MWGKETELFKQLFPSSKKYGFINREERLKELLDKELALSVYMNQNKVKEV